MLMKIKEQNEIDRKINASLAGIDFPIVHINGNMYLIGSTYKQLRILDDNILVLVGGGYEGLKKHVLVNKGKY